MIGTRIPNGRFFPRRGHHASATFGSGRGRSTVARALRGHGARPVRRNFRRTGAAAVSFEYFHSFPTPTDDNNSDNFNKTKPPPQPPTEKKKKYRIREFIYDNMYRRRRYSNCDRFKGVARRLGTISNVPDRKNAEFLFKLIFATRPKRVRFTGLNYLKQKKNTRKRCILYSMREGRGYNLPRAVTLVARIENRTRRF